MKITSRSVIAWAAAALCVALAATALWLIATVPARSASASSAQRVLTVVGLTLGFGSIGLLIVTRRSGNRIGWAAFALAIGGGTTSVLTDLSTAAGSRGSPLGLSLDLLSGISWLVWVSLVFWFLLLFPTGHLPSRRWRPFGWLLGLFPPLFLIAAILAPQGMSQGAPAPNPFFTIGGAAGDFLNLLLSVLNTLVAPLLIGVLLAAIVRFRHSRAGERQQLKWLAYWAALSIALIILSVAARNPVTIVLSNLSIIGLPITVAIAIFRYRLYDIDLLINRTFVYGATTAAIAATFFLGIVAVQTILRPLTSGSELAVAASTLISFALFQPIRRRVQGAVDQRFDRSRYDAAHTLDTFADELRDEVDLDALRSGLLGAVGRTMSPSHASLWLREHRP
ncbi:MAG: hypothetical protein M3T56_18280 [Chloroflexota bacterium]|nr:hypothetical protein [Chloroflexota bacterium]